MCFTIQNTFLCFNSQKIKTRAIVYLIAKFLGLKTINTFIKLNLHGSHPFLVFDLFN